MAPGCSNVEVVAHVSSIDVHLNDQLLTIQLADSASDIVVVGVQLRDLEVLIVVRCVE